MQLDLAGGNDGLARADAFEHGDLIAARWARRDK